MTNHSFNDLLHRIRQGKMSALEPIYGEYYSAMCGQALWIVRNRSDAEDVASEAVLKLIKYACSDGFAEVKDCGAFLYTLVKNTALDFLRKRKNTVELSDEDITAVSDDDGTDKIVIAQAMKSLSELDFKIAEMFYYYDCRIKTIAESTGLSVSAVKWHLYEIRKKLYAMISEK